jgi:hypothetical protein
MAINVSIGNDPANLKPVITITLDHEAIGDLIHAHIYGKPSPLLMLASKAEPIKVDAAHYEFLCISPDAQRFIIDGVTYGVIVDGVTYHRAD